MNNSPVDLFVSVIIPVYNDLTRLKICLEALENQTYPKASYEVIVVDNGSTQNVKTVTDHFLQVALHYESQPGSYAARNKGISISRGQMLAFTDSDCIPAHDWIEKGAGQIQKSPDCGLVAGRINMFFKNPQRLTAAELYEKMYSFDQKENIKKKRFGVTANLFTRKEVVGKVGLFNATLKSGGDLEWGNRVSDSGYVLMYADDVCVEHPARRSLRQLYKKRVRVLGGLNEISKNASYTLLDALYDLKNIVVYTLWLMKCFVYNRPPSEEFKNARQKMQYLLVTPYVRVISVFEKLRLQSGGKARR